MSWVTSKDPEKIQRFLDKLTDEEKKCYYYRDSGGSSYSDLEKKSMVREAIRIKRG